jgi:hypothetical protein
MRNPPLCQASKGRMHAHVVLQLSIRSRLLLFLILAVLVGGNELGPASKTLAYFTATATNTANTMSTVSLNISNSPINSGLFNISSNMIPGDYQLKPIDVTNGGTVSVTQQDFTYTVVNTNTGGGGNLCSLLDSSPACGAANPPTATATTGAAFLLFRCTSDAAATTPVVCATTNVYVTQVYPALGMGTQVKITSINGLINSAITGVATGGSNYITVGGTTFTGGQVLIGTAYNMGGPDAVTGTDGQTKGIAASRTDRLASVVYLPSQAGNTLANQTSTLTFTWTAQQRVGGVR